MSRMSLCTRISIHKRRCHCVQAVPPVALIDLAIQHLYTALRSSSASAMLDKVTQVEWWAQCRQPGDMHQLHFDMDETHLRRGRDGYTMCHPVRLHSFPCACVHSAQHQGAVMWFGLFFYTVHLHVIGASAP